MSCPFSHLNLERRLCENYSRQVQKTLDKLKMGGRQDAMIQYLTVGVSLTIQNVCSLQQMTVMFRADIFSREIPVLHMPQLEVK